MDDAFRAAMQRAINAGEEHTPTVVSKTPGTRIRRLFRLSRPAEKIKGPLGSQHQGALLDSHLPRRSSTSAESDSPEMVSKG